MSNPGSGAGGGLVRVVRWHDGVPVCTEDECPQFDGKRCREIGWRPDRMCEPEVRERLRDIAPPTKKDGEL